LRWSIALDGGWPPPGAPGGAQHKSSTVPQPPGAGDPSEDGRAGHPFDAIQEAIEAVGDSYTIIVRDGTAVAFQSAATNLVEGDTNGMWDIFVRDWSVRLTVTTSGSGACHAGEGGGFKPSNPTYVTFSGGGHCDMCLIHCPKGADRPAGSDD